MSMGAQRRSARLGARAEEAEEAEEVQRKEVVQQAEEVVEKGVSSLVV